MLPTNPRRSLAPAFLVAVACALAGTGCRSTTTNVTGPSDSKCAASLSGTGLTVPPGGGSGTISIGINRECSWTASAQDAWITLTGGTSGQGPGTVGFTAAPNPAATARRGSIAVNQQRAEIQQEAAACRYTIEPATLSAPSSGGPVRATVATLAGCPWTAQSTVPWAQITEGASGNGPGSVVVTVGANPGPGRSTTLTVAGQPTPLSQAASPSSCVFGVTLAPSSFAGSGGAGTVTVSTAEGCEWTATGNVPWITVTVQGGTGSGTAPFAVAANPGGSRTGTLTVAGQILTVSQSAGQAGCTVRVSPGSRSVGAAGGSDVFDVTADAGCEWTASSNAPWLAIAAGNQGTGNGRVTFSAAANPGAARSGALTIGGERVTVEQAGSCTFSVAPASVSMAPDGGPASVSVSADAGCAWTAASNFAWIVVTGGSSGSGSGVVSFNVAANAGGARDGTLTVAGQTVTVRQSGVGCSYSLSPASLSIGAAGGPTSTAVTAQAGCPWTATSADAWITITSGSSGTGAGTVAFTVGTNAGAERTGTLLIAGQTFVVSQAAAAPTCSYALNPTSQTVAAAGGSVDVAVSAGTDCAWTAASNAPWITIASGASGSGNGTVSLVVGANATPATRDGTVTIAGQTFTVSQAAAACSYSLQPTSGSVASGGGTGTVDVTTAAGCLWTASSAAAWLGVSPSSGSGSGRVTYTAAANTDTLPRTGVLAIAGQGFSVTQAGAPCTYVVAPLTHTVPTAGGSASVSVTTGGNCAWTTTSNAPWITITGGTTGTGNGTVSFSVATNTSGSARSGTLTVAGQAVTVNQP